ncbi:MAG: isochorismate synthase MenF [Rubricoccaceae bacterium]
MPRSFLAPPVLSTPRLAPADVRARLARELARVPDRGQVRRVTVPVETADALGWLAAQPHFHKAYWHRRGAPEARAALGEAARVDVPSLEALPPALAPLLAQLPPEARLYGTARFETGAAPSPSWHAFGAVRFVLPRVELIVEGGAARLAAHLMPGEAAVVALAFADALAWPVPAPPPALPLAVSREDAPDRAGWDAMIARALEAFAAGDLEKVVLARRARFAFEDALDPFALLARLQEATPRCFHALVAPEPEAAGDGSPAAAPAFVCATPERLFCLDGRRLETEAVAGTRPRAAGPDDARLQEELLSNEKEQREHAYVRDAIAARLAPLSQTLDADARTSAMTLARGRHLFTGFRATLRAGVSALDVLRALHPTPAVGGTPRAAAQAAIAHAEPFDRGLYAGPLGWIGPDGAEFAVGIRSGLVRGRELSLYSGAGIVAGSDPAAEWAEIEQKIGDFASVLGLAG